MKPLIWIGLIVLILGIASLVVPIPHSERHGIKLGDVSLGVVTQDDSRIPVSVSIVMIVGALAVMAFGSQRGS